MTNESTDLRMRAEEKASHLSVDLENLSPEAMRQTLHELMIYQIELEMQNDELLKTQCDLEMERKRYQNLYEMSPSAYCTISENEFILQANSAAAAIFGVDAQLLLLGRKITLFIHRDDMDNYYLHRKKLFETGESQTCELRMVKHDDRTVFHAHIEATAGVYHDGSTVCYAVINDITKEKRLQDHLHQTEKMESVARLAGGVAHGFNNMLSVIFGYTDMAMEKVDLSQQLFDDLAAIRKASVCCADLTSQLLTFARKQPIAPVPIDINRTIEDMLAMLRNLTSNDIEIIWQPGLEIWPIKMDALQIDQMLAQLCIRSQNSITNAGGSCGAGGIITIKTTTTTFDEAWCSEYHGCVSGDYVVIEVSDNGPGFDTKIRKNIFEPFSTSMKIGCVTGLELATVHGIVKQNNGFIKVYSKEGKGTTFTIYLPRHIENVSQMDKEKCQTKKPTARGSEKVLLVDDEPMMLKMGELILQSLGYTVLSAGSPEDAVSVAEEHSGEFDLLMTDVVMPGMNGTEVAKTLLELYPHVRCLFMSGYPADMIDHNGILDEGIHFIKKPFSRLELADKIREVLIKKS